MSLVDRTRTLDPMTSNRTGRIARIRPGDFVQALAILVVAARVEYSLRRRDLPTTAARFGVQLGSSTSEVGPTTRREPLPRWAIRRARLTLILLRWWPYGDTCLRKSLVIGNRLASLSPQLFIGIRTSSDEGSISAHAWLKVSGIDIDPTSANYVAFDLA